MHCEQIESMLPRMALDELDGLRKAGVAAHLALCPACRAKLADLRATLDLLNEAAARLPEAKLSPARRAALAAARPAAPKRLFRFKLPNWKTPAAAGSSTLTATLSVVERAAAPKRSTILAMRVAAGFLIAIVGALLLLPAFSPAREKSRRATTMNNLSQMGLALATYQESNGDYFPALSQATRSGASSNVNQREGLVEDQGAFIVAGGDRPTSPTVTFRENLRQDGKAISAYTQKFHEAYPFIWNSNPPPAKAPPAVDGADSFVAGTMNGAWYSAMTPPMAKAAPETPAPSAALSAVQAGEYHSLALKGAGATWGYGRVGQLNVPATAPKWQPALDMPTQSEERRLGHLPAANADYGGFQPMPSLSVLYPAYVDNAKVFGAPSTADKSAPFYLRSMAKGKTPLIVDSTIPPFDLLVQGPQIKSPAPGSPANDYQNLPVQPIISADRRYTTMGVTPNFSSGSAESAITGQPNALPSAASPNSGDAPTAIGALYPQYMPIAKSFKIPSTEDAPSFMAVAPYSGSGRTGTGTPGMVTAGEPPAAAEPRQKGEGKTAVIGGRATVMDRFGRDQSSEAGDLSATDAQAAIRRKTWDATLETDKKATEDERVRLRLKAVFPSAITQYPAKDVSDEIKARPGIGLPSGHEVETPQDLALWTQKRAATRTFFEDEKDPAHARAAKGLRDRQEQDGRASGRPVAGDMDGTSRTLHDSSTEANDRKILTYFKRDIMLMHEDLDFVFSVDEENPLEIYMDGHAGQKQAQAAEQDWRTRAYGYPTWKSDLSGRSDSVYAQAAKDLSSPKSREVARLESVADVADITGKWQVNHDTSTRGGGQNILYVDGAARWMGMNYASNDPIDNIFTEGGQQGKTGATTYWGADTDASIWDGGTLAITRNPVLNPSPPPPPAQTPPPPPSVEEAPQAPVFKAGPVNPWMMTENAPLSTFAVDVDTASYSIARNYIARGTLPPPASVRMEEFVNAFDYNYPTQCQGVFSVHAEAGPSPFRPDKALLKVGVKARVIGRDARKPAHFVFVVDASGSMERPDRMPLVKSSLKGLLDQLGPKDRISLVSFQTTPSLVLESAPATEKEKIRAAVDGLRCGGATNLHDGLKLGYETAARHFLTGGTNRIILCSDGVANIGETEADGMLKSVDALRRQGITLTVVGCGFGSYDDSLLVKLADRGDGNYVFVGNDAQAQRVFTEENSAALQAVALDAKIQVAFNPARVRRYRLIGFEKRILAAQDFRNDAVKGGTVSGDAKSAKSQSSTALYELELLPPPEGQDFSGDLGTVFVRYRNAETERVEEISTRLSTDLVRPRTAEKLSPRFLVAACAAEFAEILRGSEYARDGSFQNVASVLAPAAAQLPLDANVQELLKLVQRAQALPNGRGAGIYLR